MAEGKKTTTARVTAAQVNEKVDALAATVEELSTGIGTLVEQLTEQRAAQLIAESRPVEAVQEAPKQKTPVGQRDGDAIVRNLAPYDTRVRIGKESDPYRVNLAPRGQKGDTSAIPAALRGDLNYKNNLGVAFEEISEEEYDALRNVRAPRRSDPVTEQHRERTVIRDEDTTVARKRDVTPEDRLSRVGPHYLDVPGSNNPSNDIGQFDRADAEADPEYREFLRFKMMQRRERQGDFPEARQSGPRDPVEAALQSDEPEARAMAAYIRKMEGGGRAGESATGVIPKGELTKPVVVERSTVSVQPNVHGGQR